MKQLLFITCLLYISINNISASNILPLHELQQNFINLKFGMFIHFNIPTFSSEDWPDPNLSPDVFNPRKLDCNQWAEAAVSAGMKYGCLTTKHHSGFCIWPTQTTDYSIMSSPYKKDIVKEFVTAFKKRGLKVMLYYSILDTHHNIRPGWVDKNKHLQFIKDQLTELLTNYGEITAIIIDGWDAPWSRISYEDISFEAIYNHIKSIQPNCLISEHNAGKYPSELLFYTDIKHYEQNAGQKIPLTNVLPAQAGIPINDSWFWKEYFPNAPVKSALNIVDDNLIPLNDHYCNFILNVAPNKEGLIDDNAIEELKKIGAIWEKNNKMKRLPKCAFPIISENLAKGRKTNSSWSYDTRISDFSVDDNFNTYWESNKQQKEHFLEIIFEKETEFNTIGLCEFIGSKDTKSKIYSYSIQYFNKGKWTEIDIDPITSLIKLHRLRKTYKADKIRIIFHNCKQSIGISEILIYNENLCNNYLENNDKNKEGL